MHTPAVEEIKRQLRRLILSADDLMQARQFVEYILKHELYREDGDDQRTISRALQIAAIVSYSRPFSGNYDFDHTIGRLSNAYLEPLSDSERALHDRMLKLRNKAFAHTDADVRSLSVNVIDLLGLPTVLPLSHNPFVSLPAEEWRRFLAVIEKIDLTVSRTIRELQNGMQPGDSF